MKFINLMLWWRQAGWKILCLGRICLWGFKQNSIKLFVSLFYGSGQSVLAGQNVKIYGNIRLKNGAFLTCSHVCCLSAEGDSMIPIALAEAVSLLASLIK